MTSGSEPGWWVNEGPLGDHEVSLGDDGLYRVSDPDAGDWLIEKAETNASARKFWLPEQDSNLRHAD